VARGCSDSLDTLLGVLSWWGGASTFETGTLDAVVFGGQLPLIEDRELRSRIAVWPRLLDDLAAIEAQDYDTYQTVWMPFLREHAYLPQISNAIRFRPGHPDATAAPPVPALQAKVDHRSLLGSRAFQNTLLQKSWVQEDVLGRYPDLEMQMRDFIAALEAATGEM
jgi:hypothetical protein